MTFGYVQELDLTDPQELLQLLETDNESYGATGRLVRTSPKEMILENPMYYFCNDTEAMKIIDKILEGFILKVPEDSRWLDGLDLGFLQKFLAHYEKVISSYECVQKSIQKKVTERLQK
jgi:hypothetical protein